MRKHNWYLKYLYRPLPKYDSIKQEEEELERLTHELESLKLQRKNSNDVRDYYEFNFW